jgi:dUTP pyrophosphatase
MTDTLNSTKVRFKLLDPDCKPQRKTSGAVGYDLVAREARTVDEGQTVLVPAGFALELPPGTEAQIRGRSGLNAKGIMVLFGTIDSDYRGEVKVVLMNLSVQIETSQVFPTAPFTIKKGDRIAQMVIASVLPTELVEVPELTQTARGDGGFGSTGTGSTAPLLTAVVATDKEIAEMNGPSAQELIWAENQMKAARDWQEAHDPFRGLNSGTDS